MTEVTMTVLKKEIVRRNIAFPRCWLLNHETERLQSDDEFFKLEATGVRTAIRRSQEFGGRPSEATWKLTVEFSTGWRSRHTPEEFYGWRDLDPGEPLSLAEFEFVEREMLAHIAGQTMQE